MTTTDTTTTATTLRRVRVLFYAVNGLGLGHITRLTALCRAMQAQNPAIDPLFITTSEADNLLNKYDIPYIHLPSKSIASKSGSLSYRRLARMYAGVVNPVYDIFQPNIVVVDTMVTGALQDLVSILRFGNCFKVYVHRARKTDAYEDYMVQAQRFYDLVLAPHYRDSELIPMPLGHDVPLYWSGPLMLVEGHEARERDAVRKKLGVQNNELLVLISLGGGGDETNPETLKNLIELLRPLPNIKLLFAEGLLGKESLIEEHNILITNEYPVAKLLNGVDFAFASAGYNTFHELLHFGIPTAFIPKLRGYDDQVLRAKRAAEKGACFVCVEDENFTDSLLYCIKKMFDMEYRSEIAKKAKLYVPQNHVQEAAETILQAWQEWETQG